MKPRRRFNNLVFLGLLGTLVFGSDLGDYARGLDAGGSRDSLDTQGHALAMVGNPRRPGNLHGGRIDPETPGSLATAGPDGTPYPIREQDIRLNSWPRRRGDRAARTLFPAFFAGVSVTGLGLGLFRAWRASPPSSEVAP